MKTPWSGLLSYGTAFATIVFIAICTLILISVVGIAVLVSKILVIIR